MQFLNCQGERETEHACSLCIRDGNRP